MEIVIEYPNAEIANKLLANNKNPRFKITPYPPLQLYVQYPNALHNEMFDYFINGQDASYYYPKTELILSNISDISNLQGAFAKLSSDSLKLKGPVSLIMSNNDGFYSQDFLFDFVAFATKMDFELSPYENPAPIKIERDFSKIPTDVDLHVGHRIFKAHKLILMSVSDFFFSKFARWDTNMHVLEDIDPDVFQNLFDLIYGFNIPLSPLSPLETLEVLLLVQYFDINSVNIDDVVKNITIDNEDSNDYIRLINQLYPYIPNELIPYIKRNITLETDISILDPQIQQLLRS